MTQSAVPDTEDRVRELLALPPPERGRYWRKQNRLLTMHTYLTNIPARQLAVTDQLIYSLDGVFKELLALLMDRTRNRGFPAVAMTCAPDWPAPTGRRSLRDTPVMGIAGWSR